MKTRLLIGVISLLLTALAVASFAFHNKYQQQNEMRVPIKEISAVDYPEDPADRSLFYDRYSSRQLSLIHKGDQHFDFHLKSPRPEIATVILKDVDLSLFVPRLPSWLPKDENLEIIALVEREWNRQQVSFPKLSPHVEVSGGDGWEQEELYSVELARNSLNAGLWELMLFSHEEGKKALYYHGWFDFPLGHYRRIFEEINKVSYWKHWHRLEHWVNPHGRLVAMEKLRTVEEEKLVDISYNPNERLIFSGEQKRKQRLTRAPNVRCWMGFCESRQQVRFASFVAPGRYRIDAPWSNEFHRIAKLHRAVIRRVRSPASNKTLSEIELVFHAQGQGTVNRFIVGGIDMDHVPKLPMDQYDEGIYMPMGIAVGPFYQDYGALTRQPPHETPYYSVMLDGEGRWINHHEVSIEGPVIHKDLHDPSLLHLYLLSYERHTLIAHYVLSLD